MTYEQVKAYLLSKEKIGVIPSVSLFGMPPVKSIIIYRVNWEIWNRVLKPEIQRLSSTCHFHPINFDTQCADIHISGLR